MRYKVLWFALLAILNMSGADYAVRGLVVGDGPEAEPEAYATVRIYAEADTVHPAYLGVTGLDGDFNISLSASGNYRMLVSSVGRTTLDLPFSLTESAPVADLGTLAMKESATMLQEVSVVAIRPLVSKEIDRLGYDVAADEDSKTATVQDILRKVPMVTVDADGTIKVRGSSNFKIYKNGRPNNAFSNNAKEIFAAIPASMIKKIEVITDPGAREDAEGVGAILNIVTVENSSIGGVMGNVGLRYNIRNDYPTPNLWLTANMGKLALSAYGGYFHQTERWGSSTESTDYTYAASGNRQRSAADSKSRGHGGYWGLEASYDIDTLNLVTLEFGGFGYTGGSRSTSWLEMFDAAGQTLFSYNALTENPATRYLNFNGAANYQHLTRRKGEVLTLSYQIAHTANSQESTARYTAAYNFPAPYSATALNGRSKMLEQTVQADWTRPLNDHNKFTVGGKFIFRDNHANNDNDYIGWRTEHSEFKHLTTVGAAFFDYLFSKGIFNARAGLRYEYSHLSAKFLDGSGPDFSSDLHDWVPNLSVMLDLNESSTLKAAYATRINRPGIEYLNPAVALTPTSQSSGNPDLASVHYNTLSLNYSLIKRKFNIDATLAYDFANNTITNVTTVDAADFSTSMMQNAGRSRTLSLSLFGQWSITSTTTLMVNGRVGYGKMSIPSPDLSNGHLDCNVFARIAQHLPWKLRLEIFGFFETGRLNNVYSYEKGLTKSIFHGLTLQRSFLGKDALTVKLEVMNPLLPRGFKEETIYNRGDYTGKSTMTYTGPGMFGVSVSYRFGQVQQAVKKTHTSISNDDLEGGSQAPSTGSASMGAGM